MTTNDDIIKGDMTKIERSTIDAACGLLRQYNIELRRYLVVLVAGLCDVSADDMMTNTKNITIVQARWLYWYAYRYMTNESYDSIARRNSWRRFAPSCIAAACSKMAMMISNGTIWTKRWAYLKKIIRIMTDAEKQGELFKDSVMVKVIAPKGIQVEIKNEQK